MAGGTLEAGVRDEAQTEGESERSLEDGMDYLVRGWGRLITADGGVDPHRACSWGAGPPLRLGGLRQGRRELGGEEVDGCGGTRCRSHRPGYGKDVGLLGARGGARVGANAGV